jgi:hypothetical protein
MADVDDGVLIGEVTKNQCERVRVTRRTYEGHELVDARVWTVPAEGSGGDPKPSVKGLCARLETWRELIPIIREALGEGATVAAGEDPFADPADPCAGDPWGG